MREASVKTETLTGRITGFSLVELMIALALGTIIVLGAVGLFITNQRTFQLQQSLTDVQQQGSFTQGFLINDLRMIGYQPDGLSGATAFGVILSDVTANGQSFKASSNGSGTGSDVLTFAFAGTQDCGGTATAGSEEQIVESYFVNSTGDLQCLGNLTKSSVTLASGVPSFQVLYGMDLKQDGKPAATRYVTADQVAALKNDKGQAAQVVAIRVAYIVEQSSGNPQDISVNRTYMLLEQGLTDGTAPLDAKNQVRRQFEMTVPIRNFTDWDTL